MLDVLAELIQSPDAKVRPGTADICQSLAMHDFALKPVMKADLLRRLLLILRRVHFLFSGSVLTVAQQRRARCHQSCGIHPLLHCKIWRRRTSYG
jgi:hypothetical protein